MNSHDLVFSTIVLSKSLSDSSSYEYENNIYEIDSIFGNRLATFNLKVYELSYFLSSLDPMDNFERNKLYYSNTRYQSNQHNLVYLCSLKF